jgi:HEAT repeat protein
VYALAHIQRESAVQPLVAVLTNAYVPNSLKETVADALQYAGTNAGPAVPCLVKWLEGTNVGLASYAVSTLGELRLRPDLVVPALVKVVQRDDFRKVYVLFALGEFGTQATNATPTVLLALHDPDPEVRDYATNALKSIAPALLTKDLPR